MLEHINNFYRNANFKKYANINILSSDMCKKIKVNAVMKTICIEHIDEQNDEIEDYKKILFTIY